MKSTNKNLLGIALLLFIASATMAQKKYEYAIVSFRYTKITIHTHATEVINIDKKDDQMGAFLMKIEEMNKLGWEVFNTSPTPIATTTTFGDQFFYLRRELKE